MSDNDMILPFPTRNDFLSYILHATLHIFG